jgi:hypothetical protein
LFTPRSAVVFAAAGDAAAGFACLAAFLACLLAENWHRVERERSDPLAALPQPQAAWARAVGGSTRRADRSAAGRAVRHAGSMTSS